MDIRVCVRLSQGIECQKLLPEGRYAGIWRLSSPRIVIPKLLRSTESWSFDVRVGEEKGQHLMTIAAALDRILGRASVNHLNSGPLPEIVDEPMSHDH